MLLHKGISVWLVGLIVSFGLLDIEDSINGNVGDDGPVIVLELHRGGLIGVLYPIRFYHQLSLLPIDKHNLERHIRKYTPKRGG